MTNEKTGLGRALWLFMLKEGGRWTPGEVAEEHQIDRESAAAALYAMGYHGQVAKFPRSPGSTRSCFGVTAACKVPNGVTLADLINAGALRLEENATSPAIP